MVYGSSISTIIDLILKFIGSYKDILINNKSTDFNCIWFTLVGTGEKLGENRGKEGASISASFCTLASLPEVV